MTELPSRETLSVEFKSDRKGLSDSEIVLATVCLANSEGGQLYIGIENDGTVSGATPARQDVHRLAALIANSTSPALSVRVRIQDQGNAAVTIIDVPRATQLVGTRDGRFQRRILKADGTPECVGMQPHDLAGRLAMLGQLDFTAQTFDDLGSSAFDANERERLRRLIREHHGDLSLLGLSDEDFDLALGLMVRRGKDAVPTLAGLLMLGRADVLASYVPTHQVAFQVLKTTDVVINEFYGFPLGRVFEQMMDHLKAIVTEQEVMVGMFRVGVPSIDRRAFREALVNAMTHRDYARLGQIYVQLKDHQLSISSPGGFMSGVTLDNILRVAPTPRNPRLADIFKRLGLSERTGRGVDIIFEGALRYGRPVPSYARSTSDAVVIVMDAGPVDLSYVKAIVEDERRRGRPLSLDAMLILRTLKDVKRATAADFGVALQDRDTSEVRSAVEALVEAGLVQAHGTGKGRSYTMSAALYQRLGQAAEHTRQAGFAAEQQRQMVLNFARQHGSIRRADVMDLCGLNGDQASRLLASLVADGALLKSGERRWTIYTLSA